MSQSDLPKHRYVKYLPTGIQVVIPRLDVVRYFPHAGRPASDVVEEAVQFRDDTLASHDQLSLLKSIPRFKALRGESPISGVFLKLKDPGPGYKVRAFFVALYGNNQDGYKRMEFNIEAHGGYRETFFTALRFRIAAMNLKIDWRNYEPPAPTAKQYRRIMNLVPDIPLPSEPAVDASPQRALLSPVAEAALNRAKTKSRHRRRP